MKNPALKGNEEGVDNMISSKAANMTATIQMIEHIYGSAENYMTGTLGLSEDQLTQIRKNMIAHTPPML